MTPCPRSHGCPHPPPPRPAPNRPAAGPRRSGAQTALRDRLAGRRLPAALLCQAFPPEVLDRAGGLPGDRITARAGALRPGIPRALRLHPQPAGPPRPGRPAIAPSADRSAPALSLVAGQGAQMRGPREALPAARRTAPAGAQATRAAGSPASPHAGAPPTTAEPPPPPPSLPSLRRAVSARRTHRHAGRPRLARLPLPGPSRRAAHFPHPRLCRQDTPGARGLAPAASPTTGPEGSR